MYQIVCMHIHIYMHAVVQFKLNSFDHSTILRVRTFTFMYICNMHVRGHACMMKLINYAAEHNIKTFSLSK